MKRRLAWLIGLTALLALAACSLPDNVRKDAQNAGQEANQTLADLTKKLKQYRLRVKTSEFSFFRPYATREDWDGTLADAARLADQAKARWKSAIRPLLDKNDKDDQSKVMTEIASVRNLLAAAQRKALIPGQRMQFILKAKREAPKIVADSKVLALRAGEIMTALKQRVDKVKLDHKPKAADLDKRFAKIDANRAKAQALTAKLTAELAKATPEAGNATPAFVDYALIGDGGRQVNDLVKQVALANKALRQRMDSLYQAYSRTLTDMRVDCFVQIGRTSWDESDDWPTEHNYTYSARQVPCETADYFAKVGEQSLARYGSGWGGWKLNLKVDQKAWNQLNIAPKESWPSSWDDESEFWVADFSNRFYHKYLVVKNQQKSETGWEEVEEETFSEYEDCLGMDIEAKPYGKYEDEELDDPMPPGMAYVGDPRYGRWQRDSHGNQFWTFLGYYAFFNMMLGPSHHYGYGEWNTWNRSYRGQRGYYGRTGTGSWRYGTRGTVTKRSPRLSRTSFAHRGGFRRSGASIRGAGRSARGGGPGGGGK